MVQGSCQDFKHLKWFRSCFESQYFRGQTVFRKGVSSEY